MEAGVSTGEGVRGKRDAPSSETEDTVRDVPEEDVLRANLYALLARALAAPMSDDTLEMVRGMEHEADETELGRALKSFGALAARTPRAKAEEEYTELFYGMGAGGEMTPYASFYLTGFVYEKPLADLRTHMSELGVALTGKTGEPEDHIAALCEIMHGLISGSLGGGVGLAGQRDFFNRHMASWAPSFFEDLEGAQAAVLYMPVGTIGKLFMAIEAEAFEMSA